VRRSARPRRERRRRAWQGRLRGVPRVAGSGHGELDAMEVIVRDLERGPGSTSRHARRARGLPLLAGRRGRDLPLARDRCRLLRVARSSDFAAQPPSGLALARLRAAGRRHRRAAADRTRPSGRSRSSRPPRCSPPSGVLGLLLKRRATGRSSICRSATGRHRRRRPVCARADPDPVSSTVRPVRALLALACAALVFGRGGCCRSAAKRRWTDLPPEAVRDAARRPPPRGDGGAAAEAPAAAGDALGGETASTGGSAAAWARANERPASEFRRATVATP
jgi:hypothetical protein